MQRVGPEGGDKEAKLHDLGVQPTSVFTEEQLQVRGAWRACAGNCARRDLVRLHLQPINPRTTAISVFAFITYIAQSAHAKLGVMWGGNQETD